MDDQPAYLRALSKAVEIGWPESGVVLIRYETPKGFSYQVSESDHIVKRLADVSPSRVLITMHFKASGQLISVEKETTGFYRTESRLGKTKLLSTLHRLSNTGDFGKTIERGLDISVTDYKDGVLVKLSQLSRKRSDILIVELPSNTTGFRILRGH